MGTPKDELEDDQKPKKKFGGAQEGAGQPPIFATGEEMQAAIDKYFEENTKVTVAGLAYALNMNRRSLLNYRDRRGFEGIVERARNRIHDRVEQILLYERNQAGAIFNLKNNFGWEDTAQFQMTGKDGGPMVTAQMTPEEATEIYQQMLKDTAPPEADD